ncbi:hypothetical protein BDF14DRAFT_1819593 [Spinellus fusiger]|nr:hypothetical protein BDF14DRAFT_1819593 [Spinellus fusiger]
MPLFTQISIYLDIPHSHLVTLGQCTLNAQLKSVQLDINEHKGANYNFKIARLHSPIDSLNCRIKIKPSKIVLLLRKQESGREWTDLRLKNTSEMYSQLKRAEEKGMHSLCKELLNEHHVIDS